MASGKTRLKNSLVIITAWKLGIDATLTMPKIFENKLEGELHDFKIFLSNESFVS